MSIDSIDVAKLNQKFTRRYKCKYNNTNNIIWEKNIVSGSFGSITIKNEFTIVKKIKKILNEEEKSPYKDNSFYDINLPYNINSPYDIESNSINEICFYSQFSHPNITKLQKIKYLKNTIKLEIENGGIDLETWCSQTDFNNRIQYIPTIVFQIISVLFYFEKMQITHGDLTIKNILINPFTFIVKLTDFGSVCFNTSCRSHNTCSINYAAPELQDNVEKINCTMKNDIFSLGLIIKAIIFNISENYIDIQNCQTLSYPTDIDNYTTNIILTIFDLKYNLKNGLSFGREFINLWNKMLIINPEERISASSLYFNSIFNEHRKDRLDSYRKPIKFNNRIYDCYKNQIDISYKMRKILIEWIYDVCKHLKCFNIFTLTVWICDKYLSHKIIIRTKLQLIGVSSLYLADILIYNKLLVKEVNFFTKNTYTNKEISETTWDIVQTLNGDIFRRFFDNNIKNIKYEIIKEICIDENNMNKSNSYLLELYNLYNTHKF